MKKFILPAFLAILIGVIAVVTMQMKSAAQLPEAFREPDVTWSGSSGSFHINEDGSINGVVLDADGEEVPFQLMWNEQYGEAFSTDGEEELLFTAGLRLWGSQITLLIETDNVGLGAEKLRFARQP